MADLADYAIPPVELGDEISFEDEDGNLVTGTVDGFHEGVPVLDGVKPETRSLLEDPDGE